MLPWILNFLAMNFNYPYTNGPMQIMFSSSEVHWTIVLKRSEISAHNTDFRNWTLKIRVQQLEFNSFLKSVPILDAIQYSNE